jgi:site-specific recombinase XerD
MTELKIKDEDLSFSGRESNKDLNFRLWNKSKHAQYFTPNELAETIFEMLKPIVHPDYFKELSVLDPTCGSGRLLVPWKKSGAQVIGIELDKQAGEVAKRVLGKESIRIGDILDYQSVLECFDIVVSNPPYGLSWNTKEKGLDFSCECYGGSIESQSAVIVKDTPIDQHCQNFLDYQKARVTPQSYKRMECVIRVHLLPFCEEHHMRKLTQITPWLIEKYVGARSEKLKDSSVNYELGVIKNLLNKAVEWNCLTLNPGSKVKFLKVRDQKPPRYLSQDEINVLLAVCKGQLKIMVLIGLYAGLRSGEICQLEWQDIDLAKKLLRVANDETRTTKSKKTRYIPMNDVLIQVLEAFKDSQQNPEGRLFIRKSKQPMDVNAFWWSLHGAYKKASIQGAHVHTLRHTFASHLVMNGVDLYTVSKLLGHSKVQTTQIYAHLAQDHLRHSVNKLPDFGHPMDTKPLDTLEKSSSFSQLQKI